MTKHILVHKKSKKLSVGVSAVEQQGKKKKVFLVFDNMKFTDKAEVFKNLTAAKKKYLIYRP